MAVIPTDNTQILRLKHVRDLRNAARVHLHFDAVVGLGQLAGRNSFADKQRLK